MKEIKVKGLIVDLFRRYPGIFVSGEELSAELGFSRASVWKYIQKLREDGYGIEAVPHHGYRLRSVPDKLLGYEVAGRLSTRTLGKKDIHFFDEIDSTNSKACELAEAGAEEGTVVIAEKQTGGRGRMGRKWASPAGQGVYMSVILRPDMKTDRIPAITLIAALAVIRSIEAVCGVEAGMKWPNDVYMNGEKVCGILTEIRAQPDRVDFLVLGIGVNVNASKRSLPSGATSLRLRTGHRVDRIEFVRDLIGQLESLYGIYCESGFGVLRGECRRHSTILGNDVSMVEDSRTVEGKALDIDEKGALLVRTGGGEMRRIFSGDVRLCRKRGDT
ncbi:MAG: biotin--[acetyl-CoA-carboxylase] ligase [Candidatus Omnitrophica bacterium]|nr:biotin--[acetyl-CoA-carboxylase] ligase [Candidatus Omnitrophota bacterium]